MVLRTEKEFLEVRKELEVIYHRGRRLTSWTFGFSVEVKYGVVGDLSDNPISVCYSSQPFIHVFT